MADSVDAFRYISYLRSRWRLIAVSCVVATVIAAVASALMTRQYTATARIVIEPPAGSDPRTSIAVSPIYLESLKTYEQFASSDTLFRKALDKFALRSPGDSRPIEALKKKMLRVGLLRNTRILEIACTLPDARRAQAMTEYLAQSTVELSRSVINADSQQLVSGLTQQAQDARTRVDKIEEAWSRLAVTEPVDRLQSELDNASMTRSTLDQQVSSAQLELADAAEREKQAAPQDREAIRKEANNARARLDQIRQQIETLNRQTTEQEKTLAARMADRDKLEAERKVAQGVLSAAEGRLREARGDADYRGERLAIIDPGIVPERPSSPNTPLNIVAALLLGLALPVIYLTIEMNFQEQRAGSRRTVFHTLAKARDE